MYILDSCLTSYVRFETFSLHSCSEFSLKFTFSLSLWNSLTKAPKSFSDQTVAIRVTREKGRDHKTQIAIDLESTLCPTLLSTFHRQILRSAAMYMRTVVQPFPCAVTYDIVLFLQDYQL